MYFIDTGHVYTTYIESLFDKEEIVKTEVWGSITLAIVLNSLIWIFLKQYFFMYIFYFTIFHHFRQGLGISLLLGPKFNIKNIYYFLTIIPFILYHFLTPKQNAFNIDTKLYYPFQISNILDDYINLITLVFVLFMAFFLIWSFLYKKYSNSVLYVIFYSFLYVYAFIYKRDPILAFSTLVIAHGIPYVFLMADRIKITHGVKYVQKYSLSLCFLFVILGGTIEYFDEELVKELPVIIKNNYFPILFIPTIAHFILDGFIWKKRNKKFMFFLKKNIS